MEAALLRLGRRLSAISIVWTLISSVSSVILGVANKSLVLVAFGLTGLLDAAGSVALVVQFRHVLKHDEFSEKHERVSFLVVNTGLFVVAIFTMAESVHRLIAGTRSDSTSLGIVIAACSVVILSMLAVLKWRTGIAIPSEALKADGVLSATGAALAVLTIVGSTLTDAGVTWADPTAAMLIGVVALSIATVLKVRK